MPPMNAECDPKAQEAQPDQPGYLEPVDRAPSFVWPPRDASSLIAPPLPTDAREPMHATGRMIESIEVDLLGRTMISFERWAKRTGWVPDEQAEYCWRCAGSVGPYEQDGEGCASCRAKRLPWDRALRLGRYEDELRQEVLSLKFRAWRPGGNGLGRYLGQVISDQLRRAQIAPEQVRLVPVPTNPWRRISRGVDHTLVLARAASECSGCPVAPVLRARHRQEQVGLSVTARARNMKDAFEVRSRTLRRHIERGGVSARLCVVIDDVRTTGATFTACSKALRRGLRGISPDLDAQVWVCSVAVAGERSRREPDRMSSEVVM